jgi:hypothetical protein
LRRARIVETRGGHHPTSSVLLVMSTTEERHVNPPGRSARAGGNAAAADACRNGGYVNWTDAAGNAFNNQGDCVSYVARGGVLVPVAAGPFSVVYSTLSPGVFRAVIAGTGLEPGSAVSFSFVWPDRSITGSGPAFDADAGGNFTHTRDEQCRDATGATMTSASATGTPAGGSQTVYSLPLPATAACP